MTRLPTRFFSFNQSLESPLCILQFTQCSTAVEKRVEERQRKEREKLADAATGATRLEKTTAVRLLRLQRAQ
jgi:hypothetical protein